MPLIEFQIACVESLARIAAKIGAKIVRILTVYETGALDPPEPWQRVASAVREMWDRAAAHVVTICAAVARWRISTPARRLASNGCGFLGTGEWGQRNSFRCFMLSFPCPHSPVHHFMKPTDLRLRARRTLTERCARVWKNFTEPGHALEPGLALEEQFLAAADDVRRELPLAQPIPRWHDGHQLPHCGGAGCDRIVNRRTNMKNALLLIAAARCGCAA